MLKANDWFRLSELCITAVDQQMLISSGSVCHDPNNNTLL